MRSGSIEVAGGAAAAVAGGLAIAAEGAGGILKSLFVKPFVNFMPKRPLQVCNFFYRPSPPLSNVKKNCSISLPGDGGGG